MKVFIILTLICCVFSDQNIGEWVFWDKLQDGVPENAILAGHDHGGPLYIARAPIHYEGDYVGVLPGKYAPNKKAAFFSYNHEEIPSDNFEILTHTNYEWVSNYAENNSTMIPGGHDQRRNTIYICRQHEEDPRRIVPGKLHMARCYIPYNNHESDVKYYEILRVGKKCVCIDDLIHHESGRPIPVEYLMAKICRHHE